MKSFFASLTFILIFSGCSHKNAFSKFDFSKEQELSSSSLQSSKVLLGDKVEGIFSAIYLNEVYPDTFTPNEYFYIYVYLKDKKKMFDPNSLDDIELVVKLNGKLPLKMKELPAENQFSHLAATKSEWNRYYIVAFKEQGSRLNLVLESGRSTSAVLTYQKDEQ